MKSRTRFAAIGATAAFAVAAASGGYAFASDDAATPDPGATKAASAEMAAAPYLYMGWADPPSPSEVMDATGVSWFTMAFILSDGTCNPAWDSERPLEGGVDAEAIEEIRAAGGDIVPSIGGWSGNKLGPNCSSPEELAGAYQKVIDAYDLQAIDVDIENTDEFENEEVQDRILGALKIVKENNPEITTILTFGTTTSGPNEWGERLISQAAELEANVDIFTQMPFNFSGSDMYTDTVSATEGLRDSLQESFGWDEAEAYAHIGISGMNGLSDQSEETTTEDWTQLRDWASDNGLARFTFWSVNRDRPCQGDVAPDCSGTEQQPWEFSSITAEF